LKKIDLPALKAVVEAATSLTVQRGGFFFHQGEPATSFFLLINGRVRLSQIADDGRQVIFHYFRAGEAMGVAVAMVGVHYPVSAEALSDALALGWDRNTSYVLMEKYPQLAINSMVRLWARTCSFLCSSYPAPARAATRQRWTSLMPAGISAPTARLSPRIVG
jgi:CRP-like cAMP-binding protein